MLTVVHDAEEANGGEAGRSLLDEIVRDGARQMLAAALQAEVAAYVAAFADQLDENGHRLVVRNGYHQPREVQTAAGAEQVIERALRALERIGADSGISGRLVLTPACGLAGWTSAEVSRGFEVLNVASTQLAEQLSGG